MQRIGRYEVQRELARGGMGVVYAARDPGLGRDVAIKVLFDLEGPEALTRFQREATVLGRLRLPNLVAVHHAGVERGQPYLVMDLIEGESLGARLRRTGPLPPEEAVRIVLDLARALSAVHGQGVLHRDLKPDNVLQRLNGEVLLTDFGLARDAADERERLTKTGTVMGTPGFMSPEQAAGEVHRIDPRTDVYGLGALLYALLVGTAPFGRRLGPGQPDPPPSAHVAWGCLGERPREAGGLRRTLTGERDPG